MAGLDLSRGGFLAFTMVLFLLLGCVLDATTIILVIIPLFLPTARALGVDPVHFGVVSVVNCMIGLITPPYGMLLFVVNGTTGIPIKDIVREGLPFLHRAADCACHHAGVFRSWCSGCRACSGMKADMPVQNPPAGPDRRQHHRRSRSPALQIVCGLSVGRNVSYDLLVPARAGARPLRTCWTIVPARALTA